MLEDSPNLKGLETMILDMDGVIYVGDSPVEGSRETVRRLRDRGIKFVFLTNNSSKSREEYKRKLSNFGLEADISEIMTSAYATSMYLSEKYDEGEPVYAIGEEGLKEELERAGFEVLSSEDAGAASVVVVGMDRGLTYEKIKAGLRAVLSGAEFIATNPDPTYPTEEGLAPGAGASIGALSGAVEKKPSEIIGKPSTHMLEAALEKIGGSRGDAAIVGDRIETDIRAGKRLGLTTILVLSGVTTEEDVERVSGTEKEPDYVISSLKGLRR